MNRGQLHERLGIAPSTLEAFCRKWKVSEVALFGSILREDFGRESDIDVLVTFAPDAKLTLWGFVRMCEEFKELANRDVDLIERTVLERSRNYIRRNAILASTRVIYAA